MRSFRLQLASQIRNIFSRDHFVTLTGRLSLEEDADSLIEAFAPLFNLEWTSKKGGRIVINLQTAEFIYPSALILILAITESLRQAANINLDVLAHSPIHEFLARAGFDSLFSLPGFPTAYSPHYPPGAVMKLEAGSVIESTGLKAKWFADRLKEIRPLTPSLDANIVDSVDEILRNIIQHSRFTSWYGIGQCYPTSKRVRLVFYDNGQGIKTHLTKGNYSKRHSAFRDIITSNDYRRMRNDSANFAIQMAAISCVSGSDYKANSGAGLDFLTKEVSASTDGSIAILSEDGLVVWKCGEIILDRALPFKIKGTLVSITASGLE